MMAQKAVINRPGRRRALGVYVRNNWQLYLLLMLPIIFVIIFKYAAYPGLRIAFMNYKPAKGYAGSEWVGWDIFVKIFKDKDFHRALRNSLVFNFLDLLIGFPVPIILALLLNELRFPRYKKISQTVLYPPHFLSWVIIASVPYLLIGVWQNMGWGSIIYLAAITGIDAELYEAATIAGAGRWRKIWSITVPCIRGTMVTLLIMNLGRVMGSNFERLDSFGNVQVNDFQYQLAIYIYEKGLAGRNFSRATAVGLFQSLTGLLLVLASDWVSKRLGEDALL